MSRLLTLSLALLITLHVAMGADEPAKKPAAEPQYERIFDGQTFAGWEGDTEKAWRIEEGAFTAGSLEVTVPRNEFLATVKEYENFDLKLKYKLEGTEGFVNGGVQFRTKRIPNHHEVIGYQADLGMKFDGALYDESRRKKVLAQPSEETLKKALKPGEWNEYRIRAEGNHINIWLNGVRTVDYTEPDPEIPQQGIIAMQIHGNCKAIVHYKDIEIMELPPLKAVSRFGDGDIPPAPRGPFPDGKFSLQPNDVVVFVGQTDLVRSRRDGTLESLLALEYADARPRFRHMAWEGDTVYEQWRDLNFGTWADQLAAAGATVVIAQFGQLEALDGAERIPEFIAAYEKLLDQFAARTKSVVLISPRPFEEPELPHVPDHSAKNAAILGYARAIRDLAERRQMAFVDFSHLLFINPIDDPKRLTVNGIHLTPAGQRYAARFIARQLGVNSALTEESPLRAAVIAKNQLWFENFRPMNWSFAFGDRTEQPFGKPGGGHPWLRMELEEFKPLLRAADERIHETALALRAGRQPPTFSAPAVSSAPPATPVSDPAVDHSVAAELSSFKLLDGFQVNCFASEADGLIKPLQLKWDDQGRLWALCSPTYPHIEPGAAPGDYILICEDTDGDGKADRFSKFAEGLNFPMGIEFADGGVYMAEGTELVHLKDTNGDGRADTRTIVLSGFGSADSHQMINSLSWGPGGELWFTQGHHVYSHVETPWGISKLHKSGVWRYRPRSGRLDGFFNMSTAGLNGQGVAYDDFGQIFHNSGALSGGFYTVAGMIPTSRPLLYWPMAVPDRRNTGIEFIGTKHLPDDLQGCIVWGGFMSNTVQLHRLVEEGAGFTAQPLPDLLVSSRREFRPVNTRIGPDGAIYVCDWYNGIIGHYQASYRDPARDKTHGRIWRITAKDRPLVQRTELKGLSAAQLLDLLRSEDRVVRYDARRRLFDMPFQDTIRSADGWTAKLDPAAPDYERLLLEVSGVYESHEAVRPELLHKLLNARDPRVRAYGTRMIGHWGDRLPDPLALLRERIRDEHPRVRLEAIVASTYIPAPQSVEVAAQAIEFPRDRFIDYALSQAVNALKPYWSPALAQGKLHFENRPDRLRFVLEADGTKDVAGIVRKLAHDGSLDAGAREKMLALLVNVGGPEDLLDALQTAGDNPDVLEEVGAVAAVHGRKPKTDVTGLVRDKLNAADARVQAAAVRLAGAWGLKDLAPAIREKLTNSKTPPAVLAAALLSAAHLDGPSSSSELAPFAAPSQSPEIRAAAIGALALADPPVAARSAAALLPLAADETQMSQLLLPLLNRKGGSDLLAKELIEGRLSPDPAKLALRVLAGAGRSDPALVQALSQAAGIRAGKLEYNTELVKDLAAEAQQQGDAARGRQMFLSKLANCTACHKLSGQGGDIGPDLTIVGAGRSPELLVEAVLWPNRQIREGYMSIKVATDEGLVYTGYRLKETDEELTLRDTSANQMRRIAKSSIEQVADAGSVMPDGLTASMTREELVNLVRFLMDQGRAK